MSPIEEPTTPLQDRRAATTPPPRAKPTGRTLRDSTMASKGKVATMMDSLQNSQKHTKAAKAPKAKPQRAAQAPEVNGEMPVREILQILVQLQSEATRNRKVIEDLQNTIQQRDEVFQNQIRELKERFVQETQQLKEQLIQEIQQLKRQLLQETQQLKEGNRLLQAQLSQANSLISSLVRSYATVARTSSLTPSTSISQ